MPYMGHNGYSQSMATPFYAVPYQVLHAPLLPHLQPLGCLTLSSHKLAVDGDMTRLARPINWLFNIIMYLGTTSYCKLVKFWFVMTLALHISSFADLQPCLQGNGLSNVMPMQHKGICSVPTCNSPAALPSTSWIILAPLHLESEGIQVKPASLQIKVIMVHLVASGELTFCRRPTTPPTRD